MLVKATDTTGYDVQASDGTLGTVSDLLFDDASWTVRWLVVETGNWWADHRVLIPASALGHPDTTARTFPVKLTMAQVKGSPDVDTHRPVSRQFESSAYDYYGFSPYWGTDLYMGGFAYWGGMVPMAPSLETERREDEIARMQAQLDAQALELVQAREEAQREVNAIAARVGELQAQANRLNALGDRLTRVGKLKDGEFNFSDLPGQGGGETAGDVAAGDLLASLDELQSQFDHSGRQLNVLEALLFDQTLDSNSTPAGMPAPGYISSRYGGRNDPFGRGRAHHLGIDIDANSGDPVTAAAEGVVSFSGVRGGYGNVVEIDHGNGYKTLYAHNSSNLVKAGDVVRAGQRIAKVGSTGRSTGSHLHFEVQLNGRQVNPRQYLEKVRG